MAEKAFAGKSLDFDKIEADEAKLMKHVEHWPAWVQAGLGWVTKALAAVGITVDFKDIKDPGVYLDELIELVEASPSMGYGKFLALAALRYLHRYVHPDHKILQKALGA